MLEGERFSWNRRSRAVGSCSFDEFLHAGTWGRAQPSKQNRYTLVSRLAVETALSWIGALRDSQRRDGIEHGAELILLVFKVIAGLEIDPESLARAEVLGESQRGVRRDPSLAMDDLINPARRHSDLHCQAVLCHSKGDEKVLQKNFARMDGRHRGRHRMSSQW